MPEITAPDHPVHIATTAGVSVRLAANETRTVAPHIAMVAAQHGCSVNYRKGESTPDKPGFEQIESAVRALITEGNPENFTAAGRPKVTSVAARLNAEVSQADVHRAFDAVTHGNDGADAS